MSEDTLTISKNEYNKFRDDLSNQIKNASINLNTDDCYLITETYDKKLVEYFDNKEKKENNNILNDEPDIINNLSEIIEHLKKDQSIKLINKKLIESICTNNNFKEEHVIKYYAGNNKIIMEYKDNKDSKALFMINPNDDKKDDIKKNIFIISIDNQDKKELFNKILSSEKNFDEKNDNIIPFDKFINNNQEHNNKFMNNSHIIKKNKSRPNSQSFLNHKKNNSNDDDIPKCNSQKRKSTVKINRIIKNLCLENNFIENKNKTQCKEEQLNSNISNNNSNTSNPKDEKENIKKGGELNDDNKLIENLNLKEKKNSELKNEKNTYENVEDKQQQENQDKNDNDKKLNNLKEKDILHENHNELNKKNLEITQESILEYQYCKKALYSFSDLKLEQKSVEIKKEKINVELKKENSYFSIINNKMKIELKKENSNLEIINNNKEKENLIKDLQKQNKNKLEENQNLKKDNEEYKSKQKELQDNLKKLEDELKSLKNKINDLERKIKDKDKKILEINKNLSKEKDNQKYIDELTKENEELNKKIIQIKDYIKENNELKEKINTLENNNEIKSKELNDLKTKKNKDDMMFKKIIKEKIGYKKGLDESKKEKSTLEEKFKNVQKELKDKDNDLKYYLNKTVEDQEISSYIQQIDELTENNKKIKENLKESNSRKIKLQKELSEKTKKLENSDKLIKSHQSTINKNEDDKKQLQKQIDDLKQNNNDLVKKLKYFEDINNNMENKEQQDSQNLIKIKENEKEYSQKMKSYENDLSNMKNKNIQINKELIKYKNIEKDFNQKIKSYENELSNIKKLNSEHIQELNKYKEMEKKLNELNSNIIKYKNELSKEQNKNVQLTKELEIYQNNNKNESQQYNKQLKEQEEIMNKLLIQSVESNNNIEIWKGEKNKLLNQIENLKKSNMENEQKIISLYQSVNNYQARENDISNKEMEIKNKMAIIEAQNIEIAQTMQSIQKDIQDNQRIKSENNNMINQKNILEKEINELKLKLEEIKSKIPPLERYKKPTLIGLNNIGATCFMNSTLQCLSQTKPLTEFFLKAQNFQKIQNYIGRDDKLSPYYYGLIQNLWQENGPKSFSPTDFMKVVEKMNPLFKVGQAGDSKDFIIFILESLHKELKSPIKTGNNNQINHILNQYDKKSAFHHFLAEFKSDFSIISDTFFGINETMNECLNCKNNYNMMNMNCPILYNYGIFNCLIFPLEEIKNYRNNNYMNFNYNNMPILNQVTLDDCFIYNQKMELFTGENRNYCNNCKLLFDSNYVTRIYSSPQVLILILNRGKGNIYNVTLNFTETIDITKYIYNEKKNKMSYDLYGFITHIGQSGPNAHFVASCKSPIDNQWYRYNDAIVNPITNVQKEIIEFGVPYILFYQLKT